MRYVHLLYSLMVFALCSNVVAAIKTYETIDNSGLNKQERIEYIDKYLVDLAANLKNMEGKVDENSKKLKSLDEIVKVLKDAETKKLDPPAEKKSASKEMSEADKLKADILALKNQDIEKLKVDLEELKETVKAIQATIRSGLEK